MGSRGGASPVARQVSTAQLTARGLWGSLALSVWPRGQPQPERGLPAGGFMLPKS